MPSILYPDVPNVPGVPAIRRSAQFPPTARAFLGIIQGTLWMALQTRSQWGIFDSNGNPVFDTSKFTGVLGYLAAATGNQSVLSTSGISYSKEMKTSDFPLESGGFASYNKVEIPANPSVTLAMCGSESDRKSFLEKLDKATVSTNLYSIVTPEKKYINYSIDRYSYERRHNRGVTLLIVELTLKEVRFISSAYAQKIPAPKNPESTPTKDTGRVQPSNADKPLALTAANKAKTFIFR